MARNGRCFARRSRRARAGRLGQPADLDGPCRRHPRRYPSRQPKPCARRGRPGRRRRKAVSRLDRCLGNARARSDERRQHRAARTQSVRRRFQLRAAARRRAAAGAAGRRRLQPEIAARAGLLLLQPAALYGEGQPHHRRQAGRCHRAGLARSRVEQPAAGVGPERMGLALAAFQRGRQTDAVPDAPDRRPALRLRQMDRARRQRPNCSPPPTSR